MRGHLKLYNSLTRKLEVVGKGDIGLYVCGITPYDTTHLGHAFTFIIYDVLVRYLRFLGRKVTYVQNVTDIDDDILIRAKATGVNWRSLAESQTQNFLSVMRNLNMLPFDHFLKATDHIDKMVAIIEKLVSRGLAYEVGGSVYFEVSHDSQFGQRLCKLNYESMLEIANERGNFAGDPNKRDPLDFVLWQKQKTGEPAWSSPLGKGRPGWHIECSAMASKYLAMPLTFHGGGEDLKFPHHEAEISQSEGVSSKKFVKHWLHTAMVYCEGKKMSKSLGNMIFVEDLLKKYSAAAIRWYLLSHQWRRDWNYEERELKKVAGIVKQFEKNVANGGGRTVNYSKQENKFFKALNNDLDTPKALQQLFEMSGKSPNLAKNLAEQILGIVIDSKSALVV